MSGEATLGRIAVSRRPSRRRFLLRWPPAGCQAARGCVRLDWSGGAHYPRADSYPTSLMLTGTFVETPSDIHVARRRLLLASDRAIEGAPQVCSSDVSSLPAQLRGVLGEVLRASGALCVQLDEPLPPARFAELGRMLGTPLPETDPAVQRYVDDAIILNLLSEHRDTEDVSLQPFATNALTLHSESSGRPTAEQPRYIVLSCREPGLAAASAQTVLVPMQRVEQQLGSDVLLTLSQTRYQSSRALPTIVRNCTGRSVFSFRDFLGQPLEWTCIEKVENSV